MKSFSNVFKTHTRHHILIPYDRDFCSSDKFTICDKYVVLRKLSNNKIMLQQKFYWIKVANLQELMVTTISSSKVSKNDAPSVLVCIFKMAGNKGPLVIAVLAL